MCRCSSYPHWLGSNYAQRRVRGQLHAAAHGHSRLESSLRQMHWQEVLISLPLICEVPGSVAAAPVLKLNCNNTLVATHRAGSKHIVISPHSSLFGRFDPLHNPFQTYFCFHGFDQRSARLARTVQQTACHVCTVRSVPPCLACHGSWPSCGGRCMLIWI
jgi:hypothetical protein